MKNGLLKGCTRTQQGAETIEFMITFLLFLLVFFMIIDFAIALYNRGTVINASREGGRQASLFWVDPDLFDPTTPEQNQRLKRAMPDSVMSWTASNLLIDPDRGGLAMTLRINGTEMLGATQQVSSVDQVSVDVTYPHNYLVISAFAGVTGLPLTSSFTLGVE